MGLFGSAEGKHSYGGASGDSDAFSRVDGLALGRNVVGSSLPGATVVKVRADTHDLLLTLSSADAMASEWSIKIVAALLLWYAWRMRRRGALR